MRRHKKQWLATAGGLTDECLHFHDTPREALNDALIFIAESGANLDDMPTEIKLELWHCFPRAPDKLLHPADVQTMITASCEYMGDYLGSEYTIPQVEVPPDLIDSLNQFLANGYVMWADAHGLDVCAYDDRRTETSITLKLVYTPSLKKIEAAYNRDTKEGDKLYGDMTVDITTSSHNKFDRFEQSLLKDVK